MKSVTRRFSLLLNDADVQLEVLLERMPPLDIDTARMLRKENELNNADESEESSDESSKDAIDSSSSDDDEAEEEEENDDDESDLPASPAADNVEDLLGLLDAGLRCALRFLHRTLRKTSPILFFFLARSHRGILVCFRTRLRIGISAAAALSASRGQRRSVQSARLDDRVQVQRGRRAGRNDRQGRSEQPGSGGRGGAAAAGERAQVCAAADEAAVE